MPGKRAEGVAMLCVPVPATLRAAANAKAKTDGLSVAEVVRRGLAAYVDGDLDGGWWLEDPVTVDRPQAADG
jgi:hypothetical protein